MNSNSYHFEVAKATNGQKNGSAEDSMNIQKWHVYHHGCQGRKRQRKKLYFHKEKG